MAKDTSWEVLLQKKKKSFSYTMQGQYNMRSPAVKRLMKEAQELRQPTEEFFAQPLEDNLFEWHFTVRGPPDSEFDGGIYHGRIILPPDYPMKPPSIILLTPNGRFELNKKICLSISGHHPESWQPSWSIRTALLAIIGFMPTHGNGAIGSLDYTPEERKSLANKSQSWKCPVCGPMNNILLDRSEGPQSAATNQEAKELALQISFKGEAEKTEEPSPSSSSTMDTGNSSINQNSEPESNLHRRIVDTGLDEASQIQVSPNLLTQPNTVQSQSISNKMFTVLIYVVMVMILALLMRRLFFI
ncbi:ubiquitin-conjugating enzyme E2 J1-like isoform X1 [Limulus polyphemus]|uniref:Ubiquitin-conjugating enzyme E2 J1-like isoform X1 n=2 Tax=Limulus polyphemus TaxID=6850 RepID=A0ABM1S5J5_LIMPO|nr:ubiquitin-conjugating enzyme E2 J1-like isoform X1 [Limulus polyphemus]